MGRFSDGPRAWLLTEAALLAGMIDFWQMNSARSRMNSQISIHFPRKSINIKSCFAFSYCRRLIENGLSGYYPLTGRNCS